MSMAAIKQKLKVNSCKVTFDLLLLYSLSRRPLWLVGWLKPLIKLPIGHQNGQKLVGPCINMWYMIPSDRRKFEQETKLNSTFRYFDDVILQKVWGLVYRWPRYFRLNRYDNFSMLIIWWRPWHPGHMLIHGPTRFWPVSCPIGGFIRGYTHPTCHTGLRENAFFGFKTQNLTCRSENSCKATFVLLLLYSFFSVCP